MPSKKRLAFKKIFGRVAIGLIFLATLLAIYFFFVIYFQEIIISKMMLRAADDPGSIKALTPITVSDKISSFYSLFFDLPQAASTEGITESGEKDKHTLYLGSFSYTTALVDQAKTGLSFEGVSNAISFKPDYRWEQAEQALLAQEEKKFGNYKVNSFTGPYDDKRCFDNKCLEVKDNKLFYNSKPIALPAGIKSQDLHAISLGRVGSRWLVGFTLKKNGYEGQVFYFDEGKFSKLPDFKTLSSTYPGLFGFGGSEDDFLVIYGAYKGQAFRVQPGKITNLDNFFSYRVMNRGFKPEIIRAQSDKYVNWYVYSSTYDNPRFLKLWQDDSGGITGIISLLAELKINGQAVELGLAEQAADHVSLLVKSQEGGHAAWHMFKDYGFINDTVKDLVTLPLVHDKAESEIYIKKIYESSLSIDRQGGKSVKMQFSLDGLNWQDLPWGKNISFAQTATKRYFLKVIFLPVENKFYSPYIDSIIFSYTARI